MDGVRGLWLIEQRLLTAGCMPADAAWDLGAVDVPSGPVFAQQARNQDPRRASQSPIDCMTKPAPVRQFATHVVQRR